MNHALILGVQNRYVTRNLGAHRIATWLRQHDWDVEVVDYTGFWPYEYLLELVKSRVTDDTVFVGFSDMWNGLGIQSDIIQNYQNIIDWIKKNFPRVKIVVGSQKINTTIINADFYMEGYAEHAFLELIKHWLGTSTEKLKYTLFRSGKLIKGSDYSSIFMKDLRVRYEPRDFIHPSDQLGIEWSRGCKFECDFCNFFPLNVKGDNFRDVQNYIDDVKYLNDEYGVSTFYCADSTANVNNEKLALFGEETQKQLSFTPWITGYARVDLMIAHPETWDSMIAMGYTGHHYGIETLNYQTGKCVKKGMHPDKVKQGLLDIKKYFGQQSIYRTRISLIAGLPYETYDTFLDGVNWICNNLPEANLTTFPLWIPHKNQYDEQSRSIIASDYESYGYSDPIGEPGIDGSIKWENNDTNTSWKGMTELILHHPMLSKRPLPPNPWLVGEIMLTTGMSLDDAFDIKWVDNRENRLFLNEADYQFYSPAGTYEYIKEYIRKKLNWKASL